jgi:general secretion pathway protein D
MKENLMKKRVLWKSSISGMLISAFIFSLSPADVQAQFKADKYKSRSRFKSKSSGSKKYIDDESNKKTFGSRTEQQASNPDSTYVNLNFETAYGPEIIEKGFNFPNSDIMEVTKHIQALTGINLILDKDVKGKISITTSTAITVGDAWKAYLAALNMAGYTIVKSGVYYKIINARDVRYVPTKIYTGSYTPETEAHIMKIIALKNVDASEISRNFRPFMSRYGRIIDIKQTNTIIISDTGANITRLEKLIKFLDVPGYDESLQIIPVRNSSATEIAKLLDNILSGGSSSRSKKSSRSSSSKRFSSSKSSSGSQNISKIIAEPRTNSIIAMANAEGAEELRALIKKLDVKFSSNQADKIHVHYLNYGNAEELSKTLSNLVSGSKGASKKSGSRSFLSRGTEGSTLFNGEVKITADKNNNALVVTAAPTDWLTIKNVIAKLDIPRDQVYVEGLILETTASRTREFGVEFLSAYGAGNAQRVGFSNGSGDLTNLLSGNPTALSGFFAGGGSGGTVEVPNPAGGDAIKINGVNALIKAIASNTNTNVLATPQILALDNTEAEFEVGATVPVRETSVVNGVTNTSTKPQEAKLSLKITPQINKVTRFVKLKINQTINDFIGDLDTSGNGQATTTRAAITEVIVRDRDTIAMGGLLRDKETVSFNKVPLLGDIPVLGWLFKSKSKKIEKTNLLMFLTPKILSPYDKTAATHTQEALAKRMENLQNVIDDENEEPFKEEVGALTAKIDAQGNGPLYDKTPNRYQKTNENTEGIGSKQDPNTPDYQDIAKEAEKQ